MGSMEHHIYRSTVRILWVLDIWVQFRWTLQGDSMIFIFGMGCVFWVGNL